MEGDDRLRARAQDRARTDRTCVSQHVSPSGDSPIVIVRPAHRTIYSTRAPTPTCARGGSHWERVPPAPPAPPAAPAAPPPPEPPPPSQLRPPPSTRPRQPLPLLPLGQHSVGDDGRRTRSATWDPHRASGVVWSSTRLVRSAPFSCLPSKCRHPPQFFSLSLPSARGRPRRVAASAVAQTHESSALPSPPRSLYPPRIAPHQNVFFLPSRGPRPLAAPRQLHGKGWLSFI